MADTGTGSRGDYAPLPRQTATPEHNDNAIEDDRPRTRRSSFWGRFAAIHHVVMLLGWTVLLAAMIVLGLLWSESIMATSGVEPRMPWVRALSANWATSIVTICSALIRTAMAFQASLVTAMLAGLILETIGAPLSKGPYYSIIRAVDVAPISLLSRTMFRSRGSYAWLVYTIVIVEILVTTASQFLSTILVSDFAIGTFPDTRNSTDIPTWEFPREKTPQKWWTVPSASNWPFAEHADAIGDKTTHDTGHTYRAFLPFDDEARRTRLREYSGPALVMDQRVACAPPSLSGMEIREIESSLYISGLADMDSAAYPTPDGGGTAPQVNFTCELPYVEPSMDLEKMGESSLCFPTRQLGKIGLQDSLVDTVLADTTLLPWRFGNTTGSTTLFVIDVISAESIWSNAYDTEEALGTPRTDGAWAMVTNGSTTADEPATEAFRLTACLTSFDALSFEVGMRGSKARVEPRMPWDATAGGYDTSAVLHQLGAPPAENPEDRDILALAPRGEWRDDDWVDRSLAAAGFFLRSLYNTMPSLAGAERVDQGVILSKRASANRNHAHETHGAVFQDALRAAGPARAAQATLARIHQMAYYDQLPQQGTTAAAATSFSTSALIPVRWTGFAVGTALVGTHFVVVAVVAVLFLRLTSCSAIGNHWQAVSQVVSEETLPILQRVGGAKDDEVKRWAEDRPVDLAAHAVLRHTGDGRITLGTQGSSPRPSSVSTAVEAGAKPAPAGSQDSAANIYGSASGAPQRRASGGDATAREGIPEPERVQGGESAGPARLRLAH